MNIGAKDSYFGLRLSLSGQNTVLIQFCLLVYSHLMFCLVKSNGFPVEQCQMALWVFLMAYCVWLVFYIQLLLKNQSFFSLFSNVHHDSVCFSEK